MPSLYCSYQIKGKQMPILTQAHHDHFDAYGYMVIENAVPTELCEQVVDAIFAFLEMDPSDPNDLICGNDQKS